jgi:hypothetical protein
VIRGVSGGAEPRGREDDDRRPRGDDRPPGESEIRGLEVAVDDALVVGGLEAAGQLAAGAQDVLLGKGSLAEGLVERRTGDELHDEKVDAVLGVEVQQMGDVRVGEAREGVGLLAETAASILVPQGALGEHLQRDVAVQLLVVGAVDLAHAPGSEALDDAVVGERAADEARGASVAHGASQSRA